MPTGKKTATIESKALSIAIKRAMAVRDFKTRSLAIESGVPYGTLRRILELNTVADYEQLRKIAEALRMPLSSIIADAEHLQKTQGSSKITKLPITEKLRVTMRTSTSTHGPTGSRPKIPYTIISSPQSPNKQNAPVARYERRGILSYLVGLYGEAGVVAANEYFQSLANKWLRCKVCGRRPRRDFREQDTSAFECKVRFCLRSFRHR